MVVYFNGKVGSLCGITGFNGMSTILSLTMKYIDCILESIPLLYHDLMTSWLLCPQNCKVVMLEITQICQIYFTQLPHYVACTASAPVCFFVSCRAEPTNCERNLSAPVVVMV